MNTVLRTAALLVLALVLMVPEAAAQRFRTDHTLFLRPRIGLSSYNGDNLKPFFSDDAFEVDGKFPFSLGLDLGYQFTPRASLSVGYQYADAPLITRFEPGMNVENQTTTRHTVHLSGRYLLGQRRVAPYVHVGLHATFGETAVFEDTPACMTTGACPTEHRATVGPILGIGTDVALSRQVSLFLEGNSELAFPDNALDGRNNNGFGNFDLLNAASLGVRVNLRKPFRSVSVQSVEGPHTLKPGEAGRFTATMGSGATRPVEYGWSFGDGARGTGTTATHSFDTPGTYTVTFTASNRGSRDSRSLTVEVVAPCSASEIATMTASTMDPDTKTAVRFGANVRGTTPVAYRWNFGDGSTSSEAGPSHTYTRPGTYTVSLETSNCGAPASRTLSITVRVWENPVCAVAEMSTVFFERNSSTLTDAARRELRENLDILLECPNLTTQIEGWATSDERNVQKLSADRARAVEQFYVENGVAASRLNSMGRGLAEGRTSKKEGLSQFRRVETLPVR